jgi:hypothetical protein
MAEDRDILSAAAELEFPYQHSTGPVIGRFLTELRDHRRLLGIRCPACAVVQVPPQDYCERCAASLSEWREVGPEGTLTSFAVVRRAQGPHPHPAPFAYALVRLDGAGTDLLHIVRTDDYAALRAGLRVGPVWREDRVGSILDIDCFQPLATGSLATQPLATGSLATQPLATGSLATQPLPGGSRS